MQRRIGQCPRRFNAVRYALPEAPSQALRFVCVQAGNLGIGVGYAPASHCTIGPLAFAALPGAGLSSRSSWALKRRDSLARSAYAPLY